MGWQVITLRFTGVEPGLMQHNPDAMKRLMDAKARMMGSGAGSRQAKYIPSAEEEAAWGCYRTEDGLIYQPSEAFRDAIIDGARGYYLSMLVNGRERPKSAPDILKQALAVDNDRAVLFDPDTDEPLREYVIDTRRVVVNRQGVMRSRPRYPRWVVELDLRYDDDLLRPDIILDYAEKGGRYVGVGEYRPRPPQWSGGRGGPFGRFTVELVED